MRRRFLNNGNYRDYFAIEALEDGLTVYNNRNNFLYSIDCNEWFYTIDSINFGQKLYIKLNNPIISSDNGIGTFTISKKCNVSGNIMSLLYGDDFEGQNDLSEKNYAFYELFNNCNTIVDASKLILPATTLATRCYANMFHNCTSLTTAPELPATTLADYCYYYMFYGCTNLNYIKMLATDISANYCLDNWVKNVASIGTFVKHKYMTSLPTGYNGIPSGWTVEDYTPSA